VPYSAFGTEIRQGIAALNRPGYLHDLGTNWIPTMPDVASRLTSAPPARVLDLGCGEGASTIAIARAFPRTRVLGIDLDPDSVTVARAAAANAGAADRVEFAVGDAARLAGAEPFDLVTIFEALHDMGDPVGVLRSVRGVLADGGVVFVGDERVADRFTTRADPVERIQYGFSVLHCLPATMAEHPVEPAGTALRAPTVARWADEAGFGRFERLPIEHDFWQFYRLDG
jgi:SAM-dependent methyltransferase